MSLDDVELHLIDSIDELWNFQRWLGSRERDALGFDLETTGLDTLNDRIRLCQIGDEQQGWAFDWRRWGGVMQDVVKRYTGRWVGHNAPFDQAFLARDGVEIPISQVDDTRPMSHIIDPYMSTALKKQAARFVDARAGNAQVDLDEAIKKLGWGGVPIEFDPYWSYGALDPVLTMQLYRHHKPIVDEQAPLAYEVENAVQFVTRGMEHYGAKVDVQYAQSYIEKFDAYCSEVEAWCKSEYGVKPGSNAAVVKVLQDAGFEFSKATASGAVALDAEVLEGIEHPLAEAVIKRRQIQKISSTYLKHYANEANDEGLIHPSINTLGARTGRMSMSEPNLQNLPKRGNNPAVKVVRNCVVARDGHTLVFCDFSQIEMRILAWAANDVNMTDAFRTEGDFFVNLARQVYRDDSIDKDSPLRDSIKTTGYAKIYGAGVEKQAQSAGVSFAQAQATLKAFDERFTGVKQFRSGTIYEALQNKSMHGRAFGHCPVTGRRHYCEPGKEYKIANFKIQGAAAVIYKMKLLELDQAGLGPWMMIPVHDEIILDVPNEHVEDVVYTLRQVMNDDQIIAPVPVEADISYGQRWGEKRGWDVDRWMSEEWVSA